MCVETDKYIPALRFDWLTALYDPIVRFTTREKAFKSALVRQLDVHPGDRVLDLACGTGTLAVMVKSSNPQAAVVGIDGDERIIAIAKSKANSAAVEIDFDHGLSFQLPYPDESFDRVVSSLFFHHLIRANKLRTLQEIRRVLKPDGELHIADWGFPENRLMRFMSTGIKLPDGRETTTDNFEGRLESYVAHAGFRDVTETTHFNTWFGTITLQITTLFGD